MQIAQKNFYKKLLGRVGEKKAGEFLRKKGYTILKTNYKTYCGEIDLIAKDGENIVFIEVKTRSSTKYGRPCEAVKKYKRNHIIDSAKYYNYKNKIKNIPIRFDIIEVLLCNSNYKVNHIKQAFSKT